MRVRLAAVVLAAASASLTARAFDSAQAGAPSRPPDLKAVLARAAAYVEDFREKLSGIVAEETYLQQQTPGERRETRSDLLLVRSETFPRWLQFRDTFEVDAQPVHDRTERRTRLFLEPSTTLERAKRIGAESSRYNLGVDRTINVPLMPLVFLERDVQPRFRFSRTDDNEQPAVPKVQTGHFRVSAEAWVIRFEERERPTIIRDSRTFADVPTQGLFWIEPSSGRVLMSETRSNHPMLRAGIIVNYQSEPLLDLLVPVAMYERYDNKRPPRMRPASQYWERVEATATYSKFRQFQVHVEQDVDLPRGPIDKKSNDEPENPEPRTLNRNPEPNLNTNREP